ncbi:hypothetical protein CPB97_004925, partial [Podila verticillata]
TSSDNFVESCIAENCADDQEFCEGACINIGACVSGIQFADRTCRDSCESKAVDWRDCERRCQEEDQEICSACAQYGPFAYICDDFCQTGCRVDCRLGEEFTEAAIKAGVDCDKSCDDGEEKCEEKCKYGTGECKGKCEHGEHECEERCKPCDAECEKVCRRDEGECFFECKSKGGNDCAIRCGRDCESVCGHSCQHCDFNTATVSPEAVVANPAVSEQMESIAPAPAAL